MNEYRRQLTELARGATGEIGVSPGAFAKARPGPIRQPSREAIERIKALEERVAELEKRLGL